MAKTIIDDLVDVKNIGLGEYPVERSIPMVEPVEPAESKPVKKNDDFSVEFRTIERNPLTRTVKVSTRNDMETVVALVKNSFQKKSKIEILTITNSDGEVVYTKEKYDEAAKALAGAVEKRTLESMEKRGLVPAGTVEARYGKVDDVAEAE